MLCAIAVFQWLSARLQYLQCMSNGYTAVLHYAINLCFGMDGSALEFTCLTLYKAASSFSFHGGLYQPMAFVTNDTLVLKALFIVITHPQRRCWFSAKQLMNHCSNQWQHSSWIFIYITRDLFYSWWHHQMETFSASLALCEGNSPVTGEFPSRRPVMLSFDVFFNLHLNKGLSKQSWGWQFEMPSHPLWCHCNANRDHLNQQWILGMD